MINCSVYVCLFLFRKIDVHELFKNENRNNSFLNISQLLLFVHVQKEFIILETIDVIIKIIH